MAPVTPTLYTRQWQYQWETAGVWPRWHLHYIPDNDSTNGKQPVYGPGDTYTIYQTMTVPMGNSRCMAPVTPTLYTRQWQYQWETAGVWPRWHLHYIPHNDSTNGKQPVYGPGDTYTIYQTMTVPMGNSRSMAPVTPTLYTRQWQYQWETAGVWPRWHLHYIPDNDSTNGKQPEYGPGDTYTIHQTMTLPMWNSRSMAPVTPTLYTRQWHYQWETAGVWPRWHLHYKQDNDSTNGKQPECGPGDTCTIHQTMTVPMGHIRFMAPVTPTLYTRQWL